MANDLNRSIKIYLDNSAAMTSADQLQARIGELEKKLLDLQTAGKGNSEQAKKIQKELTAQATKYENYKREVQETERVLRNLSGATYKELLKAKKDIDTQLRTTTRNTDLYNKRLEVQKAVSKELLLVQKDMRTEIGCQASSWGRAADWINKYMGIIGSGMAAITGITMAFSKFRDERDKLEASSANLKALTGLDDESVAKLENAAKRLSTTITHEGVRIKQSAVEIDDSFAIIGSQRPELLKNAEALEKVTQDAIYLSIASKDKLEPAAKALTTVMNQMNLGAENSRRIINAIAAGSQAGAGNIQYITDAFEKSGTTANLMNIQLEQHIGLIEAVAPKYSEAALAGNSLDKVLLKIKEKGIGYKDGVFDLSRAIDEIATRFKKGESAASLFGAEHAKMAEILVMNKADIERYTAAVTDTNKAVEQAQINSDTNESKRAQARNKMNLLAIDLMEKLNPAIIGTMNQTVHWTGKLVALATWISENTTELLAIIAGLTAYTIAVKSAIIVDKLQVFWNEKIITSLKSMYATMLKNPYALMGAVILTWLFYMRKANQELTKMEVVQKRLNKVDSEAVQAIARQKTELELFLRLAKDESASKERRLSAMKKLNEISPEYLGNLSLEEINTEKATTAINKYVDSIYEMAKAQAAKEQLVEIEKEKNRLDTVPEAFQEQIRWWEKMEVGLSGLFSKDKADKMLAEMVARGRARRDRIKDELDAQSKALRDIIYTNSKEVSAILSENDISSENNDSQNNSAEQEKKALETRLKEIDRFITEKKLRYTQDYADGLMQYEDYQNKIQALEIEKLNKQLEAYKIGSDERKKIEQLILDYKIKLIDKGFQAYSDNLAKERELNKKKEKQTKEHYDKLNEQLQTFVEKQMDEKQKALEKEEEKKKKQFEIMKDFGSEAGSILGQALTDSETTFAEAMHNILLLTLDTLRQVAVMAIAQRTIENIGSLGFLGLAKAAGEIALINVAFGALKGLIKKPSTSNANSGVNETPTLQTGRRVVSDTTGWYDGGFTGYGGVFEVAGPVHREEYVTPNWQLHDPVSMNHVLALDAIRTQRTHTNPLPVNGFANGGYSGRGEEGMASSPGPEAELIQVLAQLYYLLSQLQGKGLKAYVVYSDIEKARDTLDKSKKIGGK